MICCIFPCLDCCCKCCCCLIWCICKPVILIAKKSAEKSMRKRKKLGVNIVSMPRGPVSELQCVLNDKLLTTALFDTGANVTLIKVSVVHKLKLKIEKMSSKKTAFTANNGKISLLGVCSFYIKIADNDEAYMSATVVADADCPFDILLGTAFMKNFNIFIYFEDEKQQFKLRLTKK